MEQIVYADIYFLINFSMDFLCLFLAAKLLATPFSFGRALAAAALGGLYAIGALLWALSPLPALLLDMAACTLLCAVAFLRLGHHKAFALTVPVFIAVSMVLGGVMTALFHLLNRWQLPLSDIAPDGLSVWTFALLAGVSGLITYLSERFFRRRTAARRASVTVSLFGNRVTLTALCDSGNLLHDPLGGKPCIVTDVDALRPLLPTALADAAAQNAPPPVTLPAPLRARLRLIPTHTATGEGLLIALRPDTVTIDTGKGARTVDALVALSPLSERADGTAALLPTTLIS